MAKLSILIPSRNEKYLQNTIDDIFKHAEGDIEVIVGLDGYNTEVKGKDNLYIVRLGNPIGQRALTNRLADKAIGKYIMKLDAHVSFAQGFDVAMMDKMEKDMVMTPMLCRLDVKNWQIIAKPFTKKYYFDTKLIMQYGKAEDEVNDWGLVETMTLQGSCFMVERENYWKWNLCDESWGSWGFQGIEVATKTWFNGGRVVTNTDTFYGHLFRGEGQKVKEIPYERPKKEVTHAYKSCKEHLKNPKFKQLLEKFNYPCDWKPFVD